MRSGMQSLHIRLGVEFRPSSSRDNSVLFLGRCLNECAYFLIKESFIQIQACSSLTKEMMGWLPSLAQSQADFLFWTLFGSTHGPANAPEPDASDTQLHF